MGDKREYYSDAKLAEDMTGVNGKGAENAAPWLLKLDTIERRRRVASEAHTLMNLLNFRWSEAVRQAAMNLLDKIEKGTEQEEMFGERTAREDREKQEAEREARFEAAKNYYKQETD